MYRPGLCGRPLGALLEPPLESSQDPPLEPSLVPPLEQSFQPSPDQSESEHGMFNGLPGAMGEMSWANYGINQNPMPMPHPESGLMDFQAVPFGNLDQAQNPTAESLDDFPMAYDYNVGLVDRCISGGCRCGDDCICIGCLTHTGHDGQVFPET